MDKALTRPFTASQAAAVETRLWGLLQRQMQHYTMAESSSVPIEVAQELLKGVNDLIGQGLYGEKDPQEQLLRGGLERVNQQVQEGLKLYQYVCAHPPVVTNRAYRETAANILAFFHTYQPQFMPHMIGCTIDYQLFLPVREGLEGIRFLNGYLTHLAAENRLLNCFERSCIGACPPCPPTDCGGWWSRERGRWLKPSGCPPWPVICTSRRGRCCLGSRWRWSMTA